MDNIQVSWNEIMTIFITKQTIVITIIQQNNNSEY